MTPPMAAWRVTYTPGEWLVLSGPTMLVVMLPPPPQSRWVEALWDDVLASRSVDALLKVIGEYGLDALSDLAAFFWDATGLHGIARGALAVTDSDTGETVVDGSGLVTWREESLGTARRLRVDMSHVHEEEHLQLPLVVGAAMASAVQLSTHPQSLVPFPEEGQTGVLSRGVVAGLPPAVEEADPGRPDADEPSTEVVGLGDETAMEPFFEPEPESHPDPRFDDDIPLWRPPADDDVSGETSCTLLDGDLTAAHPSTGEPGEQQPDGQRKVLAVPCARGHANPPGSRTCRICEAPVDAATPRPMSRPVLATLYSNQGDVIDVHEAVVVGRSPHAAKGPPGAHLMRVSSPNSDISRNHLMVVARDWNLIVTDLDSTNGTTVSPEDGQPLVLVNGESVQVDPGTVLDLGDGVSLSIEPPTKPGPEA